MLNCKNGALDLVQVKVGASGARGNLRSEWKYEMANEPTPMAMGSMVLLQSCHVASIQLAI